MGNSSETMEVSGRGSTKREYIVGGVALAFTIALCVAVVFYWDYVNQAKQYGYLGAFIISILAGGTIVVPVPGILIIFTLGSVLNPAIVGALAGLGEAVGGVCIYLTGYSGHRALQTANHRIFTKFSDWIQRRGSVAIFAMCAIFNPLFYPFTAMAGMLRFGLVKFFFLCWGGKTIKGMIVAYAGYFGLRSLLRWIGVGI